MSRSLFEALDRDCPHGLGRPAWCVLCNGRERAESRPRKPKAGETPEPQIKPSCEICKKKATRNDGHLGHRRFVPVYDDSTVHGRNPDRRIANRQVRAVWEATHTDDAGRQVCDECCRGRCKRCKAFDPTKAKVEMETVRPERISVMSRLLTAESGMWQQISGNSVKGGT